MSTTSHLTKRIVLGSSQWAPPQARPPAPEHMQSHPDLPIPFSAYGSTLQVAESQSTVTYSNKSVV